MATRIEFWVETFDHAGRSLDVLGPFASRADAQGRALQVERRDGVNEARVTHDTFTD